MSDQGPERPASQAPTLDPALDPTLDPTPGADQEEAVVGEIATATDALPQAGDALPQAGGITEGVSVQDIRAFTCVDGHMTGPATLDLCGQVIRDCSRVEIHLDDGECAILISKCELDSLEEALEMYAASKEGVIMENRIRSLAEQIETGLMLDGDAGDKSDGDAEAN